MTPGKLLPLSGPLIFTWKIKGLAGFEFKSGKLEACGPNAAIDLCVGGNAIFNLRGFKWGQQLFHCPGLLPLPLDSHSTTSQTLLLASKSLAANFKLQIQWPHGERSTSFYSLQFWPLSGLGVLSGDHQSTLGQILSLSFFKWCIPTKIVPYLPVNHKY